MLRKLIILSLTSELEVQDLSLHILLLLLQLSIHRFMLGAVRLQLVDTLLHAVNLGIQLFQLLILGAHIFI